MVKRLLYCDQDNVLANWNKGAEAAVGVTLDPEDKPFEDRLQSVGITRAEMWRRINEVEDFWETLPVLPGAKKFLDRLGRLGDVAICSSPGDVKSSIPGLGFDHVVSVIQAKLKWCKTHGITDVTFIPLSDKWKLARPGAVLIDDMVEQLEPWQENGGIAIEFPCSQSGHSVSYQDACDWVVQTIEGLDDKAESRVIRYASTR